MKYIQLNDTDLNVSRICLGTAGFGDKSDLEKSFEIGTFHQLYLLFSSDCTVRNRKTTMTERK